MRLKLIITVLLIFLSTSNIKESKPINTNLINSFEVKEDIKDIKLETKLKYLGEFILTGYCNCEICNGVWAYGPTYSGVMPTENNTIAVDPEVIPLGSYVWIDGIRYHAEDTGSAIIGKHIDVYVENHNDCFEEWCNGYHNVYLEVNNE